MKKALVAGHVRQEELGVFVYVVELEMQLIQFYIFCVMFFFIRKTTASPTTYGVFALCDPNDGLHRACHVLAALLHVLRRFQVVGELFAHLLAKRFELADQNLTAISTICYYSIVDHYYGSEKK